MVLSVKLVRPNKEKLPSPDRETNTTDKVNFTGHSTVFTFYNFIIVVTVRTIPYSGVVVCKIFIWSLI